MIQAIIVLATIGGIIGVLLGVADTKLKVEIDSRIENVLDKLPNINCGSCGYPGCAGFAEALVNGKADKISICRPSKMEAREAIKNYLETTPDKDGKVAKVTI